MIKGVDTGSFYIIFVAIPTENFNHLALMESFDGFLIYRGGFFKYQGAFVLIQLFDCIVERLVAHLHS